MGYSPATAPRRARSPSAAAASWVRRPRVRSADGAAELRLAAIAASMRPEASSSIAARRSAPRSARLRWRGARPASTAGRSGGA